MANILYTHSIMDFEPDKSVGKMTLAVLLNNKKAMLLILISFFIFAFFIDWLWNYGGLFTGLLLVGNGGISYGFGVILFYDKVYKISDAGN